MGSTRGRVWTALHFAAQEGSLDISKLLLDNVARVDVQDAYGNTALNRAVFFSGGSGELIRLLLEHGADRNLKNRKGISPLDLANRTTNFDLKQFFK